MVKPLLTELLIDNCLLRVLNELDRKIAVERTENKWKSEWPNLLKKAAGQKGQDKEGVAA